MKLFSNQIIVVALAFLTLSSCKKDEPKVETGPNTSGNFINNSSQDTNRFELRMSYSYPGNSDFPIHFTGKQTDYFSSYKLSIDLKQLSIGTHTIGTEAKLNYLRTSSLYEPEEFIANKGTVTITDISSNGKVSGKIDVRNEGDLIVWKPVYEQLNGNFKLVTK